MKVDFAAFAEDFDEEVETFQKLSRKVKNTKHQKEDSIRKQRKQKNKEREELLCELDN